MIDTIIFDADGIVLDSEQAWVKGTTEFLRRKGFIYDKERLMPLMIGGSVEDGVRIMQKEYGFGGDANALARERVSLVRMYYETELEFVKGFEEFYSKVQGKYKTCIATSLDSELLKIADKKLGLTKIFNDKIFSIADVGNVSKPAPDIFLYVAKKLNSKPQNCLVIEDSPRGVKAAKSAGMFCVALTTTNKKELLAKADIVVDSYQSIPGVISGNNDPNS
ncbi:MAG: HAD family phosphatase [Candidatus Aenigmarchaeota archaeon]|nr:HAD family phosphatase [Candidatus Aenigmarchaeota archaeon]MCK5333110.1 HAD family phosphatase [Candidatus Aenigmarchaeota archaeon]